MKSEVRFFDTRTRQAYRALQEGDDADRTLYRAISSTFDNLEADAFSGVRIPKRIIPKHYLYKDIRNLWKYDLPKGWRLICSVISGDRIVLSLIIEWFDHTNYERRFGYS
jgi:hypothetical protein